MVEFYSLSRGSRSVVSDSSRPHGLQPTRLLRPWDFPGKSTGVGCHHLLFLGGVILHTAPPPPSHIFFIHSSSNGHLASIHILVIVINTSINTGVHVSFHTKLKLKSLSCVRLFAIPWTVAH